MAPQLREELSIANVLAVPRVQKVVVNVGLGRASQNASFLEKILPGVLEELGTITGQKPSARQAKKSIAGFKLRQGNVIGAAVTLRGQRMYDFIERLNTIVFPRLRDFKGIALKNVDNSGNLNVGFKEQVVFPEINTDTSKVDFGLQVTLVTKTKERDHAIALYRKMGFIFKGDKKKQQ